MPIFNFSFSISSRHWQVPRLKRCHLSYGRFAIPRAYVLADIAADHSSSEAQAQRFWNGVAQFDGEIRDAAACVEQIGLGERLRGAGIQAQPTISAEIGGRRFA